jgi:hypothetical protein
MDLQLNQSAAFESTASPGGMPPEAPLSMPAQDLHYKSWRTHRQLISAAVLYARFILIVVTVGVTTYGVYQMLQVVRFASMTLLQGTMIFFFAVSLSWIGLGGRVETARPDSAPGTGQFPDGTGDAHLQRRSRPYLRRAAGDGGSPAAHRCASRLRDPHALRLHRRRCVDSRDLERREAA